MKLLPDPGSVDPEFERLICDVKNKGFELPLEKQKHLGNEKWDFGNETYHSESRSLQLRFSDKLSLPVLTGTKIKGEKHNPIGIGLFDVITGEVVNYGPEASAKVEIVGLENDLNGDGDNWSPEEFNNKIVREREGGKSLLTGDVYLNLKEGIGFIGDVCFRHTKCWMKRREFRLGARAVDGSDGVRVREAKTEPFIVEDRRGKLYQKHHPPSLSDAVWRLEKIGKDGAFHDRLSKENIDTVKDFLTLLNVNPWRLKDIVGMPAKIWDITVDHARTCILDKRAYLYCSPTSQQKSVAVFNSVGQLMGLLMEQQFIPLDKLSETEKADAQKLAVEAYQHWGHVVPIDDEVSSLMAGSQQFANALYPSKLTTLESPNSSNFEAPDMFALHGQTQQDNYSTDVASLGCTNTLYGFGLLGFENLDGTSNQPLCFRGEINNSSIFGPESVRQDINDDPYGLSPSNSVITVSSDGSRILTSHNIHTSDNPQLGASSHDIVPSIYSPWDVNCLGDCDVQIIDNISRRYEQTLTFQSPVTSSVICDTESMIQAFCEDEHLQISDYYCSLESYDANSDLNDDPLHAVNDILLPGSSAVAMYKAQRRHLSKQNAQRRHLSKQNAQRRWRMLFSIMRWFSVRRNVARKSFLTEMHKDSNASSQADVHSAVNDILLAQSAAVAMNKSQRRYFSKRDKAQRRWRVLFSLMRWFSVKRKVARKNPFREMLNNLSPSSGDPTLSIYSKGGMDGFNDFGLQRFGNLDRRCEQPINFPVYDQGSMTVMFCQDRHLQLLDTHCSIQSQNSELVSPADFHSAVNEIPLARSAAVGMNTTHRRCLIKGNKAQRRWRMLFSVVRWLSVRRDVAGKSFIKGIPIKLNRLDNIDNLQSTRNTSCRYERSMPIQPTTNSLICDTGSMTWGFGEDENLQTFDTHGFLQSQNSNPEAQASLHNTVNDILIGPSLQFP